MSGPGTAPSGASSSSRRASCCKPNSSVASSFMWLCEAVTTSMSRRAVKARLCPGDREHEARHDDGGGAVRTAAGDRCAGATPLRWGRGCERAGCSG